MKKMRLLLCMMLFASVLVACSEKGESTTTVCTGVMHGIDEKVTFKANGDVLEKQIEEIDFPIAELGITENELDAFIAEMLTELYGSEDEEGVTGEYEVKNGVAHITFTIDYTKADLKKLEKTGFVEKGMLATKYISLEKSIEAYEEQGLICK